MSSKSVIVRRANIIHKARGLFWRRGYRETTMQDIARACSCEPGNIYNYFSCKEDILYRIISEDVGLLVSGMEPVEKQINISPIEQMKLLIDNHLKIAVGNRRSAKFLFDNELKSLRPHRRREIMKLRDRYDKIMQDVIYRGIKLGFFAEVDVPVIEYCIAGMIIRSRIWFSPRGRLTKDEIADIMLNFILNGISKRPQEKDGNWSLLQCPHRESAK